MKRTAMVFISVILCAFAFCGCSKKNNDSSSASGSGETSVTQSATETQSTTQTSAQVTDTTSQPQTASLSLEELSEKVTAAGEWPSMFTMTDSDEMRDNYSLDADDKNFEEVCVRFCPMSAVLSEVILIKPAKGGEDAAQAYVDDRKTKLIEKYAYYPSDKENAEAAKTGSVGGIYYLICGESAAQGEEALKSAF